MKVIFCLRNFLPANVGGTEIYVNALCKGLREMGVQTIVLKPGFSKDEIEVYFYEGQKVVEYPQSPHYNHEVIRGTTPPSGLPFFRQVLMDEMPDIVHFHEISGSNGITIAHLDVVKSLCIPLFVTLHLVGYVCSTSRLLYKNERQCDGLIRKYKCAVCSLYNRGLHFGLAEAATAAGMAMQNENTIKQSLGSLGRLLSYPGYIDHHKDILLKLFNGSEKVFVLSRWFKEVLMLNGIPGGKMVLLKKALPHAVISRATVIKKVAASNCLKFVYLGRISKIKGLHLLLEALNQVVSQNWQLDIYGQTGEEDYLEKCKKIAKSNSGKIFFRGVLPPDEVLSTLQHYDALICPTVIEEMVGFVVMEAFAAGVPVIGSDSKGIAEQVKDGRDGLLFKSGSVSSLATLLQRVLDNPAMLDKLKEKISAPLHFNEVAKQVYNEYVAILENVK